MSSTNLGLNMACIFCKIVAGEIPSLKLYENSNVLAFMDIQPLSRGHCLIIPKHHSRVLTDVPDEALREILPVSKGLARAIGVENYNFLQNNGRSAHQMVDHVHFHLIPKPNEEQGLGISWPAMTDIDQATLRTLSEDIRHKMESSSSEAAATTTS